MIHFFYVRFGLKAAMTQGLSVVLQTLLFTFIKIKFIMTLV